MAQKLSIKKIDLSVKEDTLATDLKHLCFLVKPIWEDGNNFVYKKLQGGMMNQVYRCSNGEDLKDAIVVRVNTLQHVCNLVDREKEFLGVQIGFAAGITQPVFAIFDNGIVYGYAPGSPMKWGCLWDDDISRNLMRCLAKLHSVDVEGLDLTNLQGEKVKLEKKFTFMQRLKDAIQTIPEVYSNYPERKEIAAKLFWSKTRFLDEVELMEKHFDSFSFNVVFSHMDAWVNNILYDEGSDKISLIDYETCDFIYEAYDLALLFNCIGFFEHYSNLPVGLMKPSEEEMKLPRDDTFKRKLARICLEEKCRIERTGPNDFAEREFEEFYDQALMLEIFVYFYFLIYQLNQLDDPLVDFDIISSIQLNFDTYVRLREKLFSFKPRGTL